ncbi:MAG: hypothetical protein WCO38_01135 [Verrucomicrobiota bacterium]|jgi:hypothetical protein
MKNQSQEQSSSAHFFEDELYLLQLEVAHLADELWKHDMTTRGSDLEYWQRAEKAVMETRLTEVYSTSINKNN